MSNRTAFTIFALILMTLGILFWTVDGAALFLARKFTDLVQWVAFWR